MDGGVKEKARGWWAWTLLIPLLVILGGCESDPVDSQDRAFAQVGQIQVQVQSAVAGGTGGLEETLAWRSDGPWVLAERISYQGQIGGETVRRPVLNPGELAPEYGSHPAAQRIAWAPALLGGLAPGAGARMRCPPVYGDGDPAGRRPGGGGPLGPVR